MKMDVVATLISAKVLQDRANSGKRLRLSKSSEAGPALFKPARQANAVTVTSMPSPFYSLKQRVQILLEGVNGGMIPV